MLFLAYFIIIIVVKGNILISNTIPLKILQEILNYNIIYHYENETQTNFEIINGKTTILINYDRRIMKRPSGFSYFHFIYLKNTTKFNQYANIRGNLNYFDTVFFVTEENLDNLQFININCVGSIFFYNIFNKNLYTTCFYCGKNNTGRIKLINENGNFINFINNFTNFYGEKFLIGYGNFPPFFEYLNNEEKGLEAKILKTLSHKLNFTYKLIQFNETFNESGWEIMIKSVENEKIHWAISGISASVKRFQSTDFSRLFKSDTFRVLYIIKNEPWYLVKRIIFLLKLPIILCIIISILIIVFISKLTTKLYKIQTKPTYYFIQVIIIFIKFINKTILFHLQASISTLLDQSIGNVKFISNGHFNIRILYVLWWMLSVCITTYYKSKLASILINPHNNLPNNIDELVKRNYKFQANYDDWSLLKEYLENSTNPTYKTILNNINNDLDKCEAVLKMLNDKVALFDEETAIEYQVNKWKKLVKSLILHF